MQRRPAADGQRKGKRQAVCGEEIPENPQKSPVRAAAVGTESYVGIVVAETESC